MRAGIVQHDTGRGAGWTGGTGRDTAAATCSAKEY